MQKEFRLVSRPNLSDCYLQFSQEPLQGLIESFNHSICLWMIGRCDYMLCFGNGKQILIYFVHKLSALV